jgi:hypothetical protein
LIPRTQSAIRSARCPVSPGQLDDQLVRGTDRGEITAQPGGLGDHPGVFGVGLRLAAEHSAHPVHDPTGHIDHRLAVDDQRREQQRGGRAGQVDRPPHVTGRPARPDDQLLDRGLVIGQLLRPAHLEAYS